MSAAWRERLYPRLAGQPTPLLVMPDQIWTAASLWAGARQWTRAFRDAGIGAGDRVVCALPSGASFVQLLVAALWEDVTLAIVAPRDAHGDAASALLHEIDARLIVQERVTTSAFACAPSAAGWPTQAFPPLRAMQHPRESVARLLLRTSGTSGAPRWVALSDANLLAVLDSHLPLLALDGASVLSVLPWHHAFGLVLGLLAALLAADEIVRDGADGRDLDATLALARQHPVTHVDLVPILASRLFERDDGARLLRGLRGGVVGGAPVSAALAMQLATTRMRVGYGQTEAAPGILLGAAGEWSPRFIGRAVGCEVRTDAAGVLSFRGANASLGEWRNGVLQRRDDAWIVTGDVVESIDGDAYRFVGRASDAFKLPNGLFVDAPRHEEALRSAFPQATHLLLRVRDDDVLELLLSAPAGHVSLQAAREALGPLGDQLRALHAVDAAAWQRSPKGEIDRARPLR